MKVTIINGLAGTGKTTYAVNTYAEHESLFLAFTRNAADAFKQRSQMSSSNMSTIHSFFSRFAKKMMSSKAKNRDNASFKRFLDEISKTAPPSKPQETKQYLEFKRLCFTSLEKRFYSDETIIDYLWTQRKKENFIYSYELLLLFGITYVNTEHPKLNLDNIKYLIVDEYQDINELQYEGIKCLINSLPSLEEIIFLGDEHQRIFGFAVGDFRIKDQLEKEYGDITYINRTEDYRHSKEVLDFVNGWVAKNKIKDYPFPVSRVESTDGEFGYIESAEDKIEELLNNGVSKSSITVLTRTNRSAENIGESLIEMGIPINIKFNTGATLKQLKNAIQAYISTPTDVLFYAILKLTRLNNLEFNKGIKRRLKDNAITSSDKKIILQQKEIFDTVCKENTEILDIVMKSTLLNETIKHYVAESNNAVDFNATSEEELYSKNNITYSRVAKEDIANIFSSETEDKHKKLKNNKNGVTVSTIHRYKGLENDVIIYVPFRQQRVFGEHSSNEERSVVYTAITRAKQKLFIDYSGFAYNSYIMDCLYYKDNSEASLLVQIKKYDKYFCLQDCRRVEKITNTEIEVSIPNELLASSGEHSQPLIDHLQQSGQEFFGGPFNSFAYRIPYNRELKYLTLAHDIGKADDRFQKRLLNSTVEFSHADASYEILNKTYSDSSMLDWIIRSHHNKNGVQFKNFKNQSINTTSPSIQYVIKKTSLSYFRCCAQHFNLSPIEVQYLSGKLKWHDHLDRYLFINNKTYNQFYYTNYLDESKMAKLKGKLTRHRTKLSQVKSKRSALYNDLWNKCKEYQESKKVITIKAPTGAGKTLSSLRLASERGNKIIYVAPFLSITQGVVDVLNKIIGKENVADFTSLGEVEYEQLDRGFIEYNFSKLITVITGFKFIEGLFFSIPLVTHYTCATFIIDEWDSFSVEQQKFAEVIIEFLTNNLECTVIIMSATIEDDKADILVKEPEELKSSIKDLKIKTLDDIEVKDKTMIIINRKKDCKAVFNQIKNKYKDHEVIFHSGDLVAQHKIDNLTKIQELTKAKDKKVVVVGTLGLQRGLDASFEMVIRESTDKASMIQSRGRCNRYGEYDQGIFVEYQGSYMGEIEEASEFVEPVSVYNPVLDKEVDCFNKFEVFMNYGFNELYELQPKEMLYYVEYENDYHKFYSTKPLICSSGKTYKGVSVADYDEFGIKLLH